MLSASSDLLNIYLIETVGDLWLDEVGTGDDQTAFLAVPDGSIRNGNSSGGANVITGRTLLFAAQDIGTELDPIVTTVGNIEATSTAGATWVSNLGALEVGGRRRHRRSRHGRRRQHQPDGVEPDHRVRGPSGGG